MKIVKLEAENFKRLRAVEITPSGDTVVIAGRNAQGKSSVLDAIWAALAGKNGVKEVVRPIRDGESKARVVLELDDLRVERKWTPSGSTLTVGPRDGSSKFNSPQAILDKLIGALSFDPLAFAEADAKTQRTMLLALTGLQDEVDAIEAERRAAYDERTEVNREAKRLKARLQSLPPLPSGDVEKVDVGKLVEEIGVAQERERLKDAWTRLDAEIRRAQEDLAKVEEAGRRLPGTAPLAELTERLANAEEINRKAELLHQHEVLGEEFQGLEGDSYDLTEKIKEAEERKTALLANAALPVPGLGVDDDGVTLNGVPFVQASAAERLRVSVGMAMAANPDVRVICIKDASLLDSESFATIQEMAAEKDFQVWFEQVGDGGPTGVVIEDGMVQG